MKTLFVAALAALSLAVVPTASADTYTHYINCGTGAYIYTVHVDWNGYSNTIWTETNQIWGRC